MRSTKKGVQNGRRRIRDRTLGKHGWMQFASSSVATDGKELVVQYRSGAAYRIPLSYIADWFTGLREEAKLDPDLRIVRSRRIADSFMVRIYISSGKAHDIVWDTALMACEPRYEHHGGLTASSRALARRWAKKHGSFRIE